MTVLPIVERELRTASRRVGTYWGRTVVALVAVALACSIFVVNLGAPAGTVGVFIYRGLAGLLLLYCLFQGRRASADCLSEEKREGTLGLLFLTDLKGYDVVVGKLVATSMGGFYGLMTVFPVLALTLLLGGVSSGEFWRMVLVLIHAFLLSLAVGVATSSVSRDQRLALAANLLLLLCLIAIPPACASLVALSRGAPSFPPPLMWSCPFYTFWMSFDLSYKGHRADFWCSLALIHVLIWLLVGAASWIVPHTWQDRPTRAGRNYWRGFWRWMSFGPQSKLVAYRRRLLSINAFYWLAARPRLRAAHVWTFLICLNLWWLIERVTAGALWAEPGAGLLIALLQNSALKIWCAIEAGQRLAEDQHAGALELVLSTPLGVNEILRGQWLALRRQFLWPLVVALVVEVCWLPSIYFQDREGVKIWLAGMFMLLPDMLALSATAMRTALTARNHNRATVATLSRLLVLPWAGFGLCVAFMNAWVVLTSDHPWDPSVGTMVGLWAAWGLGVDLWFGLRGWWQARTRFREFALQRYASRESRRLGWPRRRPAVRAPAAGEPSLPNPQRPWRRWKLAATVVLVAGVGVALMEYNSQSAYPAPLVLSVATSNNPVSVTFLQGQALLIVLPDGSLWRWGRSLGQPEPKGPIQPERIGEGNDWIKTLYVPPAHWLAMRRDGTLWQSDPNGPNSGPPERQVCADGEWVDMAWCNSVVYLVRRDGTLWKWAAGGRPFTALPAPPPTYPPPGSRTASRPGLASQASRQAFQPEQVGTNKDWVAIRESNSAMMGLRKDGTLWAWGQIWPSLNQKPRGLTVPAPVQVCRETNWTRFAGFGSGLVWNRDGELWEVLNSPPSGQAYAGTVGAQVLSNSAPQRVTMAIGLGPELYEIRTNGTLWGRPYQTALWPSSPTPGWRQVGKRNDWVAAWNAGPVAVGLTTDGTLWTWGLDLTRQATPGFWTKLEIAKARLAVIFGSFRGVAVQGSMARGFLRDPQPLLKMKPVRVAPGAATANRPES